MINTTMNRSIFSIENKRNILLNIKTNKEKKNTSPFGIGCCRVGTGQAGLHRFKII
jgi:hypothetical protein